MAGEPLYDLEISSRALRERGSDDFSAKTKVGSRIRLTLFEDKLR